MHQLTQKDRNPYVEVLIKELYKLALLSYESLF